MRETLEFSVAGIGNFEVYQEATFLENRRIENELSALYGSNLKLLEAQLDIQAIEKKFSNIKEGELIPLERAEDYSLLKVMKEVMSKCLTYSSLKVLKVKVPCEIEILTEEDLKKISEAWGRASERFFRSRQKREAI